MIVVHSYAYVWFAALPYRVTERLLRTHERIHRGSFIHALIRFTRVSARSVTHCTVRYSVDLVLVLVFHRVLDKWKQCGRAASGPRRPRPSVLRAADPRRKHEGDMYSNCKISFLLTSGGYVAPR